MCACAGDKSNACACAQNVYVCRRIYRGCVCNVCRYVCNALRVASCKSGCMYAAIVSSCSTRILIQMPAVMVYHQQGIR